MEAANKAILFLIVGVVVGAAVGVGAGYFVFDDGDNDELRTTYWFYLDDGKDADSVTGWYSATSDSQVNAFKSAMDKADIEITMSDTGYVSVINGMGYDAGTGAYWALNTLSGMAGMEWIFSANDGFGNCVSTMYAFIYGAVVFDSNPPYGAVSWPSPSSDAWMDEGPFA